MAGEQFCYFNNGGSFRLVDANYIVQTGEVLFSSQATSDQLTSAFPSFAAQTNNFSIKQQIAALEAAQTARLVREAVAGVTTTITDPSSPLNGLTPAAALAFIESHIAVLRSQLQ